jgi:hypothetical protein
MTPRTLRTLARALTLAAHALEAEARQKPRSQGNPTPARRKLRLTPQRKAALKLQGTYIGTMRMLPAMKKARVKREREARGMVAAIRLARKLGRAA